MFTRVVELVSKQGKARELSSTINDKIVPILKKQPGFVDAERYQREQYNSVRETLQSVLEAEPVVRTFEVHSSTGHKITAGKAA